MILAAKENIYPKIIEEAMWQKAQDIHMANQHVTLARKKSKILSFRGIFIGGLPARSMPDKNKTNRGLTASV